jgi:hypothetical protein
MLLSCQRNLTYRSSGWELFILSDGYKTSVKKCITVKIATQIAYANVRLSESDTLSFFFIYGADNFVFPFLSRILCCHI